MTFSFSQNQAPVVTPDPQTTPEDMAVTVCPPISDVDDLIATLTVSSCLSPLNGMVTGPDAMGCYIYTPAANFNGLDSICSVVCDDGTPVLCDTAFSVITINPVNDRPIAVDDLDSTYINTPVVITVLSNDDDSNDPLGDIDPTTVTVLISPSDGSVAIDPVSGNITYTPSTGFTGGDYFKYVVCDDGYPLPALCDTAEVDVTVIPFTIEGTIMSSTSSPLQSSTVYLIEHNTTLGSLQISNTTTTGATGFYQFNTVSQTFYIKAVPDQTLYPSDLPTYYTNSGVFQYATAISTTGSPINASFNTAAGLNPGGAGFIAGFVGQGAGKNSAEGDPVENLDVVLVNANLDIVAHTKTDNQGLFEFNNLEIADYSVWVDNGSVDNTNAPLISLGTENNQADLKFVLEEDALKLKTASSIKDLNQSEFKLYPNPSNGIINISSLELNGSYIIEIINMLGKIIYSNQFEGKNTKINLSEKGFNRGTYFLKLSTNKQSYYSKVILN